MKTASQKYKRRHWYKFTDWQSVMWIVLAVLGLITFFYYMCLAVSKHREEKNEKAVDSVVDSAPTVETKDDTAKFDTVIDNTRIVIKTNRPIKVKVQ